MTSPRLSAELWEIDLRRRTEEVETARLKLRLAVLVLKDVLARSESARLPDLPNATPTGLA